MESIDLIEQRIHDLYWKCTYPYVYKLFHKKTSYKPSGEERDLKSRIANSKVGRILMICFWSICCLGLILYSLYEGRGMDYQAFFYFAVFMGIATEQQIRINRMKEILFLEEVLKTFKKEFAN